MSEGDRHDAGPRAGSPSSGSIASADPVTPTPNPTRPALAKEALDHPLARSDDETAKSRTDGGDDAMEITAAAAAAAAQEDFYSDIPHRTVGSSGSGSCSVSNTSDNAVPPAAASPSSNTQKNAIPDDNNIPVPVPGPYRRYDKNDSTTKPRGILKPAPPPQARFSFRRDVLNYVGESLSPLSAAVSSSASSIAPTPSSHPQQRHESVQQQQQQQQQRQQEPGERGTYGNAPSNSIVGASALKDAPAPPSHPSTSTNRVAGHAPTTSTTALNVASQATPSGTSTSNNSSSSTGAHAHSTRGGTFWKRLGGAVTAVAAAANAQVPQAAARTLNHIGGSTIIPVHGGSPSLDQHRHAPGSSGSSATSSRLPNGVPISPSQLSLDTVKSVRFTMSSLTVVYPIESPQPPGTEATTRKKVNKEYRMRSRQKLAAGWTGEDLTRLYDECCRTREEPGIPALRRILSESNQPPKVIDLKNQPLTKGAVEVLADVLSVEFGLKKLVLENCGLDDDSLKPLIHSLLVSGTLPTLSLANNKRIRSKGWKMIAVFVRKAHALRYLDISDNLIDKKVADFLVEAISTQHHPAPSGPIESRQAADAHSYLRDGSQGENGDTVTDDEEDLPPRWAAPLLSRTCSESGKGGLTSLRMENCSLKNPTLDALANGVRQSGVKHISLRRNRINNLGAVALAVMIRDYELPGGVNGDSNNVTSLLSPQYPNPESPRLSSSSSQAFETARHPSAAALSQPRPRSASNSVTARLEAASSSSRAQVSSPNTQKPLPTAYDSTMPPSTSYNVDDEEAAFGPERNRGRVRLAEREAAKHSEMKLRLKKQIDALPRVGTLLTLDVRTNELKGGVTYIAQVLKRNRTLRVLNLSDNKIDGPGLASLAEALKYNSTLETLDLSNNPCCGPTLEGINVLRVALALNGSLMRVFLNNTDFTSDAAIALAEFLPDVQNLIHLDLSDNPDLDIAGIMALSASVKLNHTLRCLDLSIPPNDPEFARLSQDILQSCIRNTELAQVQSSAKGVKVPIATPIYKSGLARDLKILGEGGSVLLRDKEQAFAALPSVWKAVVSTGKEIVEVLASTIRVNEERRKAGDDLDATEVMTNLIDEADAAQLQIMEALRELQPGETRDAVGLLSSHLAVLIQKARALYGLERSSPPPHRQPGDPSANGRLTLDTNNLLSPLTPIRSPASPNRQVPSPSFSITDSDDSDAESSEASDDTDRGANEPGHVDQDSPLQSPSKNSRATAKKRVSGLSISSTTANANGGVASSNEKGHPHPSPRSPVESQSRSLTLEEGEVFRKGLSLVGDKGDKTLLDVLDEDEEAHVEGDTLKQEILETPVVSRPRRLSASSDERA